jgi:hypothetical protein
MNLRTSNRASRVPAGVALAVACALGAFSSAPADASAQSVCTAARERLLATWGAWDPDEFDTIAKGQPGSGTGEPLLLTSQVDPAFRQGPYATAPGLEVRTGRDRTGRGRPVLCTKGRALVRLPSVAPHAVVGGVSTNGTTIAWREWRSHRPGRVHRAQVVGGQLRHRQSVAIPPTRRAVAVDGRIVVSPDGLVAWAGGEPHAKHGRSTVTVWPTTGRPRTTTLPDDEYGQAADLTSIRPTDRRHLLTNVSDRPIVVGPRTAGRCPIPVVGSWKPLGRLQALAVRDTESEEESDSDLVIVGSGWVLVCDPRTSDVVQVLPEAHESDKYDSTNSTVTRIANDGPWLLAERAGDGYADSGPTTTIFDTRDRTLATAAGPLDVPGGPAPTATVDPLRPIAPPGVVAVPGAVASTALGRKPHGIVLRDATGRRVVGTGPPAGRPILTLTPTPLSWTTSTVPGTFAVRPLPAPPIALLLRLDLER